MKIFVFIIYLFSLKALTNKGNCCYAQEDYDKARYYYEEALNIDAGSVEALHNLSKSF
jgi:intraflagellar transport protein 88